MGSFGERLQREREMRRITLEEIAEATKIGTRSLRALEEEDFDKLPGGIFNKGFVRAYSKYLGIDEEQAVADYVAAVAEAQAAGKASRTEFTAPDLEEKEPAVPPIRLPWMWIFAAVVLVGAVYAGHRYYSQHGLQKLRREPVKVEKNQPPAPPVTAPVQQTPASTAMAPVATPTPAGRVAKAPELLTASSPGSSSAADEGFVLRIRAREESWVSVTADGHRESSGVMAANTEKTVHAMREVILKTGNAGGVDISFNDKAMAPIGAAREVRTVTFGPQGVRQ